MNNMEAQLAAVAASYDAAIEAGRREGPDPYHNLPREITGDPDYEAYRLAELEQTPSERPEIKAYLGPEPGMRFVDLGCCMNLMFRGYASWPSAYYGVDISARTIEALQGFVAQQGLTVGALWCGRMDRTPFTDGFFDIAACIGVLEYFEAEYVAAALAEMRRILRPQGRLVLDVPNLGDPACRMMMRIEAYLGRPDRFDLPREAFERMLAEGFAIEQADDLGATVQYFLRRRQ